MHVAQLGERQPRAVGQHEAGELTRHGLLCQESQRRDIGKTQRECAQSRQSRQQLIDVGVGEIHGEKCDGFELAAALQCCHQRFRATSGARLADPEENCGQLRQLAQKIEARTSDTNTRFNIHLDALNYSRNEVTAVFTKNLGARLTDLCYQELVAQPLRLLYHFQKLLPAGCTRR